MEPSNNPTLFIVAGPNGAGKTSLSNDILKQHKVEAFDWDLEFDKFWAQFSYDSNRSIIEGARERTTEKFETLFKEALESKRNFAFETNFHTKQHIEWAKKAKQVGHRIVLIFMYMRSIKQCVARVKERVYYGGHDVSEPEIRSRYIIGLQNLNDYFNLFDDVLILDASLTWEIAMIAEFSKGKVSYRSIRRLKENEKLLDLLSLKLALG